MLRQFVECSADDQPMAVASLESQIGDQQVMQCRDLRKLRAWALEDSRGSCFRMVDDYTPTAHNLEKFAFCSDTSPYHDTMVEYFEQWGHKQMFVAPPGSTNP